jgi:DNA-binding transcriptional ArsR family regulator
MRAVHELAVADAGDPDELLGAGPPAGPVDGEDPLGRHGTTLCLDRHIPSWLCSLSMPTTWSAVADPHRRAMLALMLERPRPVGELVERVGLSQPGTSKHLRVLREAGLVRVRQEAQRRVYELEPGPLAELDVWLAPYRRLWNERLDALERHLDRTPRED